MAQFLKRTLDASVALSGLIILSPLLLVIAVLVKLGSQGPVFFWQVRLGRHGLPFRICKFRSMYSDSKEIRNPDGSSFSGINDPRVTPIGRWLRSTSIDELPQLLNVLAGEMSLVGPRPDQWDQIRYYSAEEHRKLLMKPGITGLAQVCGRNRISWDQRKKLDLEYVDRWSLLLDLSILMRTIPYVLLRQDIHKEHNDAIDRTTAAGGSYRDV